jgi:D-proline reductase (dithiol) PrdB
MEPEELIKKALESHGISTVTIMMYREILSKLQIPRTLHVRFPFGRPMGEPNNPDQHRVILEDALHLLQTAKEPGTVVYSPLPLATGGLRRHPT